MRRHTLNKWPIIVLAMVLGVACQTKKTNSPPSSPPIKSSPEQLDGEPSSTPGSSYEQDCREDECDYEEADEEAMIHVIEIDDLEESPAASAKEASSDSLTVPLKVEAETPLGALSEPSTKAANQALLETSIEAPTEMVVQTPEEPSTEAPVETAVQDSMDVVLEEEIFAEAAKESSPLDFQIRQTEAGFLDTVESILETAL